MTRLGGVFLIVLFLGFPPAVFAEENSVCESKTDSYPLLKLFDTLARHWAPIH